VTALKAHQGLLSGTGGILVLFGYLWMGSRDNDALLNEQRRLLQEAGVKSARLYEDSNGARYALRPQRQACLEALNAGDILLTWELERFVDSRADLTEVLRALGERSVQLKVLSGKGAVINSAHISLDVVSDLIDAINAVEARVTREATVERLAAARAKGQVLGAKPKMTAAILRQAIDLLTSSDSSFGKIANELGVGRSTLYNYLKGDGSLTELGTNLLSSDDEASSTEV